MLKGAPVATPFAALAALTKPAERRTRRRKRKRGQTAGRAASVTEDVCRIDVWLWRARFFKTRSLAARVVEEGGMRLVRGQSRIPIDKPSRTVRCGDVLTFSQGPRWVAVRVEALGERRGPATEARGALHHADRRHGCDGRKRRRVATLV